MNRFVTIVAVLVLVVGLLAGYLWWGVRTQQQLNGVQGQLLAAQSDLKAAQDKIKTLEGELGLERDRRQKLEEIVTKGRK